MRTARILVVALLLPLSWLTAPAASACTCAVPSPTSVTAEADAVVHGTYLGHDEPAPRPDGAVLVGGEVDHRIQVERVLKGDARPGVLTLRSASSGGTCGIGGQPGERMTLPLSRRDDGAWTSSLCAQLAVRDMPVPGPGTGPGPGSGGADLAWLGALLGVAAIGVAHLGGRR